MIQQADGHWQPPSLRAGKWLATVRPERTEDYAFILFWHAWSAPDEDRSTSIAKKLLETQRKDGGWGQTLEMESDA